MPNDLTPDEMRAMAAEIGMTRLDDDHLEELQRATKTARARRTSLRVETLAPTDEPGHVFRLGGEITR